MGTGYATGASGIGPTVSGLQRVFARSHVIIVCTKNGMHCQGHLGSNQKWQDWSGERGHA